MSNAFFAAGAKAFADKKIDFVNDSIRTLLLDASFVPTYDTAVPNPNIINASFLSDVISAAVGTPVTLTGKSNVAGVLNADNPVFPGVSGNVAVRQIVYQWTGNNATSILLFAWDTADGFPMTPTGGNIDSFWDTGISTGVAGLVQL